MNVWKIVGGVLGGALILAIGLLIGHFGIPKTSETPSWVEDLSNDVDEAFIQEFMKEVSSNNIREHLRKLSAKPHMATTKGDEDLVKMILNQWKDPTFGLDDAKEERYDVYLSFPKADQPNNVRVANATLRAQGTPPVQNVIFTAAKQVQTPVSSSLSVYDNWIRHFNRTSTIYNGLIPQLGTLGAGSDYAPFLHYLGISCMDLAYTYDRSKTSARIYPAYHTAFDTFDYTDKHIDPGFTSHQAVARTAGNVLLRLADSLILPLGPRDYSETLENYYKTAETQFSAELTTRGISLVPLKNAIARYQKFSDELDKTISELKDAEKTTPLRVRMINDQLMLLERAFINHFAFPDKLYYSHVIWASRSSSVVTFPGIADAYAKATSTRLQKDWDQVHHHITVAATAVDNAASTLEAAASV
ncbi:aminopeptidase NAALADL1 [Bufo gargarizans]|uniref:aminopeptidase NAALADL1 n=1 Tax=Bufo gargarizans TaxID=30331 RepID=UPI001CF555B5|nr:aminopeptidase NAALADL1 [Bufo gargarizans]